MRNCLVIAAIACAFLSSCTSYKLPKLTPEQQAQRDKANALFAAASKTYYAAEDDETKSKALADITAAAEADSPHAMYFLGHYYHTRKNRTPEELKLGVSWLKKAAKAYDPAAMSMLGVIYLRGDGVMKSSGKAWSLFNRAAKQRDRFAMYNLGLMYLIGYGIEKDASRAADWFYAAAKLGDARSMVYLGNLYLRGRGTITSYGKAEKWFKKAAEKGDAEAMFLLGQMCKNGIGHKPDPEQAVRWWVRAADKGHKEADKRLKAIDRLAEEYEKKMQAQKKPDAPK